MSKAGCLLLAGLLLALNAVAQVPPDAAQLAAYDGLFKAVADRDMVELQHEIERSVDLDQRDAFQRSALHLATFLGNHEAMRALVAAGADANALEWEDYDIVTIAAVADDLESMKLALKLGCRADNITSRYQGTALIAAAHLGHVEIVAELIRAGAPLDHVNNLHWTALIESIVLGDGGRRHSETLRLLVEAGADLNLADRSGKSPLHLAKQMGYSNMVKILQDAGAR